MQGEQRIKAGGEFRKFSSLKWTTRIGSIAILSYRDNGGASLNGVVGPGFPPGQRCGMDNSSEGNRRGRRHLSVGRGS